MSELVKHFASALKDTLPSVAVRPAMGKDKVLPAVIYAARNGMRDAYYVNSFGLRNTEFTVTVYSKSYTALQDLKESIVSKFHGFTGILGTPSTGSTSSDSILTSSTSVFTSFEGERTGSSVSKVVVTNILDGYSDDPEPIHRSTILIDATD